TRSGNPFDRPLTLGGTGVLMAGVSRRLGGRAALILLGAATIAAACAPIPLPALPSALIAVAIVVLIPGLAVVASGFTRSPSADEPPRDFPAMLAVAFAGVGIACISLWLGASAFGMSRWTSFLAPLVGAAVVALAA